MSSSDELKYAVVRDNNTFFYASNVIEAAHSIIHCLLKKNDNKNKTVCLNIFLSTLPGYDRAATFRLQSTCTGSCPARAQ